MSSCCPLQRRLDRALAQIPSDAPVRFTVKLLPYQSYPNMPHEGQDKYHWYRRSRYGDSEEKMKMYITLMSAYGIAEGIDFKFGGTVASTLHAHRVIQHFQKVKGPEIADKLIKALYRLYFEEEQPPSSPDTLLRAAVEAGIERQEAVAVGRDQDEGLMDVKMLIREQAGNGIDSVPHVLIGGNKRDMTLEGCREVEEYRRSLERIIMESQ